MFDAVGAFDDDGLGVEIDLADSAFDGVHHVFGDCQMGEDSYRQDQKQNSFCTA
jgi:hypothetical protein